MKSRRRGQVLVIAALVIALTLLTAQAYVYDLSRTRVDSGYEYLSDYIRAIDQGSRHTITASLVNISRGGANSNLGANLGRWEDFVSEEHRFGRCDLNSTPASEAPYTEGVWLDWGVDGDGISSAFSDFALNLNGRGAEIDWSYSVNVTTRVLISGSYTGLGGDSKEVAVIVDLFNEGAPSLTGSTILEYLKSGNWTEASVLGSYSEMDYGNGTYQHVFTDDIPGTSIQVRVRVYDRRGVYVEAEATLAEE